MLPHSKVRLFINKIDEMGGLTDSINIMLPDSSVGQYHKTENREYYRNFIDELRAIPGQNSIKAGIPSLNSWFHEYNAHTKGNKFF